MKKNLLKKLGITACALALLVAPTSAFANTANTSKIDTLIQNQLKLSERFRKVLIRGSGDRIYWADTYDVHIEDGYKTYMIYDAPSSGQLPSLKLGYIKDNGMIIWIDERP